MRVTGQSTQNVFIWLHRNLVSVYNFLNLYWHFKNKLSLLLLLAPKIGVCRYSIYTINSLTNSPIASGHGSDAGLIRLIILLAPEKVLSYCQSII